jgi:hypothetical protein
MTPIHQQLVDEILERMHQRVQELIHACQPAGQTKGASPTSEQLRQTVLGQHLAAIAHYVEGYPYPFEGDVRASAGFVARCLYGDPLASQGFRLPAKWQRTELGSLVHAALLRFYEEERPGQLLTVTQMRKLFGVTRQTVHQWIEDGVIFAVYRGDTPLFYQKDVTRLQQVRAHKQSSVSESRQESVS